MKKPNQMEAFDALYSIASGDGREDALFGTSIELARPAYEKTLIGNGYPTAYLEFPLLGSPCFDLLSVHGRVECGARFAPGAGFGYEGMLAWFQGVCKEDGTEGRFALAIRFNYAKVKFTACEPRPAKFYLTCLAGEHTSVG